MFIVGLTERHCLSTSVYIYNHFLTLRVSIGLHLRHLCGKKKILANEAALKDLHARAQGEVSIREALSELAKWGEMASFSFADYTVRRGC